jgi:hypothetical protein
VKKRIVLGLAALAAVAATAAPASAHVTIKYCMPTNPYPCGVCITEGPVDDCT